MTIDAEIVETAQCLCLASRRAARAITGRFDRALRAQGIKATQFTLLAVLALKGPLSIGEIAALIGADRTTLTRNAGVAAKQSLVAIRRGDDARSRIVSITATGRRTLKRALPVWRKIQGDVTNALGEHAAQSLRRIAGNPQATHKPSPPERRL